MRILRASMPRDGTNWRCAGAARNPGVQPGATRSPRRMEGAVPLACELSHGAPPAGGPKVRAGIAGTGRGERKEVAPVSAIPPSVCQGGRCVAGGRGGARRLNWRGFAPISPPHDPAPRIRARLHPGPAGRFHPLLRSGQCRGARAAGAAGCGVVAGAVGPCIARGGGAHPGRDAGAVGAAGLGAEARWPPHRADAVRRPARSRRRRLLRRRAGRR